LFRKNIVAKFFSAMLLLQPLRWRCVDCVIHHERDVRKEQQYICVARTSANKQSEWLRRMIAIVASCHSVKLCAHAARAFPIATLCCVTIERQKSGRATNVLSETFVIQRLNYPSFFWKEKCCIHKKSTHPAEQRTNETKL